MKVERLLLVWRWAATPKSQSRILPAWVRRMLAAAYTREISWDLEGEGTGGGTFDVAVDDALAMEEGQRYEHLAHDEHDVLLLDRARLHLRETGKPHQLPAPHLLHAGGLTSVRILPPLAKSIAIHSSCPFR